MSEIGYQLPLGRYGPVVRGGRPRHGGPDWRRVVVLALVIVLSVSGLMATAYAGLLWYRLDRAATAQIRPVEPFDVASGAQFSYDTPDDVTEITTVLLVGSDSREGLSREQLQAIGTENTGTNLTDTIILLQLNPSDDTAAMLSFPRDLLVTRCDGTRGRINAAYFIGEQQREGGGPGCLVQTVEQLTGIHVDHYVGVNFAGFVQAVDAIGGVTFYLDEPLQDRHAGLDVPAGCVHFDGTRAIQFVRARRLDPGGDFGRIARQQRFALEVVRRATSIGTLLRPDRVTALINSIADTLETDTGFSPTAMVELVTSMRNLTAGGIEVRTVPGVARTINGASVVEPLEEEARQLFRAFRNGDLLPTAVGTAAAPQELTPANVVPLVVLNGSGIDGRAREAAAALEALGFRVAEIGTADAFGFEASVVIYPPDKEDHAALVAERLGGLTLTPGAPGDPLRLVVGTGFDVADLDLPEPSVTPTPTVSPDGDAAEDLSEQDFRGAQVIDVQC